MKRLPDESYEKYREHRKEAQKNLKIYLKGRVWWDSYHLGPYRRTA